MIDKQKAADCFTAICAAYDVTRDSGTPADAVDMVLQDFSINEIAQTLSAISKIKEHDGRIYGKNREFNPLYPIP